MKKYWHIALMLFCVFMITSCGDDDEALEVDEVWKVQNEEAFQAQMLVPGRRWGRIRETVSTCRGVTHERRAVVPKTSPTGCRPGARE